MSGDSDGETSLSQTFHTFFDICRQGPGRWDRLARELQQYLLLAASIDPRLGNHALLHTPALTTRYSLLRVFPCYSLDEYRVTCRLYQRHAMYSVSLIRRHYTMPKHRPFHSCRARLHQGREQSCSGETTLAITCQAIQKHRIKNTMYVCHTLLH